MKNLLNFFLKKQKTQADKYLNLIDNLELKESTDISDNIKKLIKLKAHFNPYKTDEIQLVRTEVNSLVEDFKQNSLFTSMITTMLAVFTIIFTILREQLGVYKITVLFTPVYILIIGYFLIRILLMYRNYAEGARKLNQLMSIIDLIIQERRNMDLLHQEAYKEYIASLREIVKIHNF